MAKKKLQKTELVLANAKPNAIIPEYTVTLYLNGQEFASQWFRKYEEAEQFFNNLKNRFPHVEARIV